MQDYADQEEGTKTNGLNNAGGKVYVYCLVLNNTPGSQGLFSFVELLEKSSSLYCLGPRPICCAFLLI